MTSKKKTIGIAGAGFSGAVLARQLAEAGYLADVFESRDHVAGNCHTVRDPETSVMMHYYGPHIFHTDSERVWNYLNEFTEFMPFTLRTKAIVKGSVYSLPINLHTINQFFGKTFSPSEAREFVEKQASQARGTSEPSNMEEQAVALVGSDIYRAFIEGYTLKQWGRHPRELPASIIRRLPVRFNYEDNYFFHPYQGMPKHGYTSIVEALLDHQNIRVHLETTLSPSDSQEYDHVFWSGPLDAYFDFDDGRLGYRTLDFELIRSNGDFQGNPIINYPDLDVPHTRITEHKHFTHWEEHEQTVCYRETSRECEPEDIPYYPIRLVNEKKLLRQYIERANDCRHVTFVGRLGTYRYLDMDVTIREALETADAFLKEPFSTPPFVFPPI